jgi:predicted DsbA family dithiol-disulfide isomerase
MLKINLYSDIVCPWCIIGQHRLDKVLAERFPDLKVDVEHHPFELMPTAPLEGIDLRAYFRSKGIENPSAAFARPEAEARASGLTLELAKQSHVYRTVNAHTLLREARARGTQHALAGALMEAYFHDQKNISDPAVLDSIAVSFGFSEGEARRLVESSEQRAITEAQIVHS